MNHSMFLFQYVFMGTMFICWDKLIPIFGLYHCGSQTLMPIYSLAAVMVAEKRYYDRSVNQDRFCALCVALIC